MFAADTARNDRCEFNSAEAADEVILFSFIEPALCLARVSVRQNKRNDSACIEVVGHSSSRISRMSATESPSNNGNDARRCRSHSISSLVTRRPGGGVGGRLSTTG